MANVFRAPLAEADLDDLWDYVARDSDSAADALIDTIVEKCRMLANHPEMGERRPELAHDLRSFVVGNYVVFYRSIKDGIEVARVLHSARDINALF
jgi:toxin ParE1/3/4